MRARQTATASSSYLDDEHMRKWVDLGGLARVGVNFDGARQRVAAANVHRT